MICWWKVFKVGDQAVRIGCWPMRCELSERFDVVFSFAVVLTATESPLQHVVAVAKILPLVHPHSSPDTWKTTTRPPTSHVLSSPQVFPKGTTPERLVAPVASTSILLLSAYTGPTPFHWAGPLDSRKDPPNTLQEIIHKGHPQLGSCRPRQIVPVVLAGGWNLHACHPFLPK